jgi:hypothetical protein
MNEWNSYNPERLISSFRCGRRNVRLLKEQVRRSHLLFVVATVTVTCWSWLSRQWPKAFWRATAAAATARVNSSDPNLRSILISMRATAVLSLADLTQQMQKSVHIPGTVVTTSPSTIEIHHSKIPAAG